MSTNELSSSISQAEKIKVAYALNLCAVSISQIIDSRDLIVLKQERENILNNLNLQNFVKHPALLDILKQTLDTITYLEIQAGDLEFIEKEYQQKLKNAIWSAVPSPGALFLGGNPVTTAIAIAAQIGTGYMNYRRNKSQYALDKERSLWELRKHELEQLYGLRSQLFETAWKLSSDYNFDDELRLSQKQISRFSEALLEEDPLKRYERLDVMSKKFAAFPPFWYYKGNAAMEIFRSHIYGSFLDVYKSKALDAYNEFHKCHFNFLREDIIAASCCIEHISLLEKDCNKLSEELLDKALSLAGDNYDILQQSIFINLRFQKFNEAILPLREMIANNYNVGLNGILLSRIYFAQHNEVEYQKLLAIAGEDNVLPWSNNVDLAERQLIDACKSRISDEYRNMAQQIVVRLKTKKSTIISNSIYNRFIEISVLIQKYLMENCELRESLGNTESRLKQVFMNINDKSLREFYTAAQETAKILLSTEFSMQISEDAPKLIEKMKVITES